MVVSLFLCLTVDNVLCFSMPRSTKRITNKAPLRMNTNLVKVGQDILSVEQDKISVEQDKISLRREELALEAKKMNQDKVMGYMKLKMGVMKLKQDKVVGVMKLKQEKDIATLKIIVSIFAIFSFIAFSVQLKDGLLGQATTLNSYLKYFSSSFNELKAWIYGSLATITGVVVTKPLHNALNYLNKIFGKYLGIILDRVVKWRRSLA